MKAVQSDVCIFPKCKHENVLVWLGRPLCQKHWEWVCDHKAEANKRFGIQQTINTNEEVSVKTVPVETKTEEKVETKVEVKTEAKAVVEKKTKQAYTKEIDEQLLELSTKGTSVGDIAKTVGRSYASVTYRLNRLKKDEKPAEKKEEEKTNG